MARPKKTDLELELRWICERDPRNLFLDRSGSDEIRFPNISKACKKAEPEEWSRNNRTGALLLTLERAIELMPDKKHPDSSISWKEIARILLRFEGALEPRSDGKQHKYADYVAAVEREVAIPPGNKNKSDWLKTQITGPCRELLADALTELEKQSSEGGEQASADEDEPVMSEKGASEKPSKEPDSPPVNQSNYGLFNLVSHGPTSINLKKSVYAGGISIALVVAVLLATNLGSGSSDDSSETDSSSGPVETEASNSVSDSSAAPAVRGEQIQVTDDCFGGSMIPNKTIQDIEVLDEEIEERNLLDGTPEGWNEVKELRGTVDSVIAVSFVVHASREAPVTIDKITPEIVESPAPEGVILRADCGDPMPSHFTRLDLDSGTFDTELPTNVNHPLGTKAIDDISAELNYYELVDLGLPFEITEGNPGSFLVVPTTEECWCEWTLTVEWSSHEDEGEITFDNEGEPFVTVSPSQMDAYRFTDAQSGTSWVQEDL